MLRHRKRKKCLGAFEETVSNQNEKVSGITIPPAIPAAPPDAEEENSKTLVNVACE